jgi:hypothetical protein
VCKTKFKAGHKQLVSLARAECRLDPTVWADRDALRGGANGSAYRNDESHTTAKDAPPLGQSGELNLGPQRSRLVLPDIYDSVFSQPTPTTASSWGIVLGQKR